MAEMFILKPAAQAINDGMYAVREAANNKGANITPDTPLISNDPAVEDWADKIEQIPTGYTAYTEPEAGTNRIKGIVLADPLIIPTSEGVSSTLELDESTTALLHKSAKKVIIPEYFSTLKGGGTPTNISLAYYGVCEEIETNALSMTYFGAYVCSKSIKKLVMNKVTNISGTYANNYADAFKMWYPTGAGKLTIVAPDLTSLTHNGCSGTEYRELEFAMPELLTLKGDNYTSSLRNTFQYAYGVFKFPKLTEIRGLGMTQYSGTDATKYQDWRFPSLTTLENMNSSYYKIGEAATVKNIIRIGPNLGNIGTNGGYVLNSWATQVTNGKLEIHIPAGDSTTKTNLDAKSVTYIQDYDYQADM